MIRDTFTARVCFFFFFFARVCVGLCAVREFGVVAGRERNDFFFCCEEGRLLLFATWRKPRGHETPGHGHDAAEKWRRGQIKFEKKILDVLRRDVFSCV